MDKNLSGLTFLAPSALIAIEVLELEIGVGLRLHCNLTDLATVVAQGMAALKSENRNEVALILFSFEICRIARFTMAGGSSEK